MHGVLLLTKKPRDRIIAGRLNGLMIDQRISLTLTAVKKFGIDRREISLLFKSMIASISAYRNSRHWDDQNLAMMALTRPMSWLLERTAVI
jgi:hypothetical protein